jgi:hypothetical protein
LAATSSREPEPLSAPQSAAPLRTVTAAPFEASPQPMDESESPHSGVPWQQSADQAEDEDEEGDDESHNPRPWPLGLGIAAVMLGALGGVTVVFPQVEVSGATIAAIGLLLALSGVVMALLIRRRHVMGWPIVGAVACVGALALAGPTRLTHFLEPSTSSTPTLSPSANHSAALPTALTQSEASSPPPRWIPATESAQIGQVRVRVTSTKIGRVTVVPLIKGDEPIATAEEYLAITVEIQNLGTGEAVEYQSWAGRPKMANQSVATLRDDRGRVLHLCDFAMLEPSGRLRATAVNPAATASDVLVFDVPPEDAHALHLELPAANVQLQGLFRFEIPADMVQREGSTSRPARVNAP